MLILASRSPRRQELLRNAGISFMVRPAAIPEMPHAGEDGKAFVKRLAREKARVIAHDHPHDFVLGADTTVALDGKILNKPSGAREAAAMLRMLSGRTHQVMTGVCVIAPARPNRQRTETGDERPEVVRAELTSVSFARLDEEEIAFYGKTGEWMDKAGGYAIQGIASRWIWRIEGDYSNVVGLPVALVYRMLREYGLYGGENASPSPSPSSMSG
jgi:septum formation protein